MREPVSMSAVPMIVRAAALLDVARRAEEALRLVQRVRVHAAGEDLARVGHHRVVGPGQARDRVEQDHDVAPVLTESARLLDHHVGDLDVRVAGSSKVEEITSAFTLRSMSVTSSGRSSMSSTIR